MSAGADTLRRGWCPGALRPMQSGDGLIVRIKPRGGTLALEQLAKVCRLAGAHGNGMIELTSRANVQLRGVTAASLDDLTAGLDGLGLLDRSPQVEARRNVIASPLAGLDAATFDTRPLAAALEDGLIADDTLAALSDKFGFLIDGGGPLSLGSVEADVRFAWNGAEFAIGLAREQGCDWVGTTSAGDLPATAIALARAFLVRSGHARRMRLLGDTERRAIAIEELGASRRNTVEPAGASACNPAGRVSDELVAVALPFGATTAEALQALIGHARAAGAREIRLTPWRALLFPLHREDTETVLRQALALGFIVDPNDPRRAVAACPGAPACANGSTPVRSDAGLFTSAAATALAAGLSLHVSGCAKGCARRQPADLTLVAADGRYGVVVNGSAPDRAFGRYSASEVAEALARLAQAVTQAGLRAATADAARVRAAFEENTAA